MSADLLVSKPAPSHPTDAIHIVLGTDEAYSKACQAVIAALCRTTDRPLVIHLLSSQSESTLEQTCRMASSLGASISAKSKDEIDLYFATSHHLADDELRGSYYLRLWIADLLPDVDRVIYLDSDLVVRSTLSALWDTDLEGAVVGAVACPSFLDEHEHAFRQAYDGAYFNSGVMLMDLNLWRAKGITQRALDWVAVYRRAGNTGAWRQFWDQSPLNMTLRSMWKPLSPTWNYTWITKIDHASHYGISDSEMARLSADPAIYHFIGPMKPWDKGRFNSFASEFLDYLEQVSDGSWGEPANATTSLRTIHDLQSIANLLFSSLSRTLSPVRFVQIGAHNGAADDPINQFVRGQLWVGVLVEPVPYLFQDLQRTYADLPTLSFRQAAIGKGVGMQKFYAMRQIDPIPFPWYTQLGSFNKDVILSHVNFIPGIADLIQEIEVETMTLDDLLHRSQIEPDVVVVDTEGADDTVLESLSLDAHRPEIIYFEVKHISKTRQDACARRLKRAGYVVISDEINAVAFRRTLLGLPHLRDVIRSLAPELRFW